MYKKGGLVFALLLVVALTSLNYSSANSDDLPFMVNEDNINQLEKDQKYDIIVKVDENERDKLESFDIKEEFGYGNLVALELNKSEIEKIMDSEVKIERKFKIGLSAAVSIVNATKTWPLKINGMNLTGVNTSVCVIDTGVDYTHSDLGGCYGNNNYSSGCKVIGGYDFSNGDSNPMDDHGHGTHVAGIISANGSIRGVAPDSKIIAIKALDSSGSGSDSQIIRGIEWCVGNATLYNIVAISMSFGDEFNYTSYCNSDTLAPSINAAVGKNISVVVASGNSGNFTSLSSPACIQNATAVGATTKSDGIGSYSNRNSLLSLVAPGSTIVSTCLGGGSCSSTGTSMSTPVVSGAIAILREFTSISRRNIDVKGLERTLNSSGVFVYDSSSNRNYSRIDIFRAVNELSFNYVNLVSPNNGYFALSNQSFVCNASSVYGLVNSTFYLWNSTSLKFNQTNSISNLVNSSTYYYNFTNEGSYSWNCLFYNNQSLSSWATNNFSVTYDLTTPSLNILSPLNNSWLNAGRFNVTLSKNGECKYSLTGGATNNTMSSSDSRNFSAINSTLLQDANYNVTYYCNDSNGNINSSSTIFFRIDLTEPNVSSISPSDNSESSGDVSFQYNVTDNLNLTQCNLVVNGASVISNSSAITNGTNTISNSMGAGIYSWNINCIDEAGNTGSSSVRTLSIAESSGSGGSGGGGGGGGGTTSSTYTVDGASLSGGYTKEIGIGESIKFSLFNIQTAGHTLSLDNVESSHVNITLRSDPIKISLRVGEERKINLTSKDYYDLYVKLESIKGKKASITIRSINEVISKNEFPSEEKRFKISNGSNLTYKDTTTLLRSLSGIYFLLVLVILVNRVKTKKDYYWLAKKRLHKVKHPGHKIHKKD